MTIVVANNLCVYFLSILIYLQKPDAIYVAAGSKVFKLDKITGAIVRTYSKGKCLKSYFGGWGRSWKILQRTCIDISLFSRF